MTESTTSPTPDPTSSATPSRSAAAPGIRWRWWLLAAGLLLATVDVVIARAWGVTFEVGGRDASTGVWTYLAAMFGALGFLVGWLVELRRRERAASVVIRRQEESLAEARVRLAQNEKLATLGQLSSAIAHEVRNPLAIIRSTVQNTAEDLDDLGAGDLDAGEPIAEARRSCAFVIEEIDRLGNVCNGLLAFARPLDVQRRPVDPADLLDRIELLGARLVRDAGVTLRRERSAVGLPTIAADFDLASQLLLGLVENAAKATPAGGELAISATQSDDDAVEIAVTDGGPGVPADLRERIFEPFFSTRDGGTGLGLAVARQIVAAHGGSIAVDDAAGGGARFRVRLPIAAREVA